MLRKLSFFFNFRHKKWLDLNQDIICIIKHNKKAGEVGTGRGWKCWEEKQTAWWVVGDGGVGEVPARRKCVATALTLDSGSNAVSLLPQGRDTCSIDRVGPSS